MTEPSSVDDDEMPREIDFTKGRPNPYWLGLVDRSCVRLIDKDLAAIFTDDRAVNEALRTLVRVGETSSQKISAKTATAPKSSPSKARS
jgi:hypothetical protein